MATFISRALSSISHEPKRQKAGEAWVEVIIEADASNTMSMAVGEQRKKYGDKISRKIVSKPKMDAQNRSETKRISS